MTRRRLDVERPHDRGFPEDGDAVRPEVGVVLSRPPEELGEVELVRRALDARRRRRVPTWQVTVEVDLPGPPPRRTREVPPPIARLRSRSAPTSLGPVVVVGAGPAGIFAALHLSEHGCPVVLIERGKAVESRSRDFGRFRGRGELDPESNLCFGEGGAGTYSDGKLTCRTKDPQRREILERLVEMGGPPRILVDAKPHVGTNLLYRILKEVRQALLDRGVQILHETRLVGLRVRGRRLAGVDVDPGGRIDCRAAILATGHSARDVFELLGRSGATLEAKPFALGVRAEHPQRLIDAAQYHLRGPRPETLPPADYRLAHTEGDRGVYSFCMCPGGMVVPTATEPETVVVNGMSSAKRGSPFANSGLVVQVTPEDLRRLGYGDDPLAGVRFQRDLERRAFQLGGGGYRVPAVRVDRFLAEKPGADLAPTHFRPGIVPADLDELFPAFVVDALRAGLRRFDRQLRGYASSEGNLLAVESRTSSPVRVLRDPESRAAVGLAGVYLAGEGPGYAGGIMSAALDGLRTAHALLERPPG